MSDSTEEPTDNFFESTEPTPGNLPPLNTETFRKAGVTPYADLQEKFGMDYGAVVAYAADLRGKVDMDWLHSARLKANWGGAILYAKLLAEHGGKGDDFWKNDAGCNRNSGATYINLHYYFPWAYDLLLAKAKQMREEGDTYAPSLNDIIAIGRQEADRLGVARPGKKGTYTGTGKVLMVDPAAKTVDAVDMPPGFPGAKATNRHWTQEKAYELQTGGFGSNLSVAKGVETQLWIEEGGHQTGYYEFDLPLKDSSQPKVTLKIKTPALLMRVNKKEVLEPFPADAIAKRVDFNAREPKLQSVFDIDPSNGKVDRVEMLDNELVTSPDGKVVTLLNSTAFTDLSVMQIEANSVFAFTIAEQRFKGRSFLLRLEDSQWIAPLGVSMSAGDVKQHVVFNSLEAAVKEAGEELPVDPNEGFEELNDERCSEYFGIPYLARLDLSVRNLLEEQVGALDIGAWIKAGYAKSHNNKTLFNIARVRELVDDATARVAKAEVDGFGVAEPTEYGAVNHGEAHDLAVKALGSRQAADLTRLVAAGYVRIVGGKRLYHIGKMRELMAKGRAASVTEMTGEPGQIGDFSPKHVPETELRLVQMRRASARIPDNITDYAVYRALWEPSIYSMNPEDQDAALRDALGLGLWDDETTEDNTEEAEPESVDAVQDAEDVADERMLSEQSSATVTPDPEVIEPKLIEPNYAEMGHEARGLANRKVIDSLNGWLQQIERVGIGCLTRNKGKGQTDGATTREWLADALDTIDKIVSIVRQAEPDVTKLAEHLDILMAEALPNEAKIKAEILWLVRRNQPHLTIEEIASCYVETPSGRKTVFNGSDQPTA